MSVSDPNDNSSLEAKLQQIGAELAVLTAGTDEGLIPLFSLSTEVLEREGLPEEWIQPMETLQRLLDTFLDTGKPVDEAGIASFNKFSEWLNAAIENDKRGEELPPLPEEEIIPDAPPVEVSDAAASPFEMSLRRLASELEMLQIGSDEGLIPLFSLSTDLLDLPDLPDVWSRALEALQGMLESYLDRGNPIDEVGFQQFVPFKAWLSASIENESCGEIIIPWEDSSKHSAPPPETPSEAPVDIPTPAVAATPAPASAPTKESAPTGPAPIDSPVVGAEEEILVVDTSDEILLQEFFQEAMEHLESIEGHLLTLETQPQDVEGLAAVFRAFHSVKGVAGFLQLKPIQRLAHQVESLLDLARNHEIILNSHLFTLILESCDQLKAMTNMVGVALEKGSVTDTHYPIAELVQRIENTTQATIEGRLDSVAPLAGGPSPAPATGPTVVPVREEAGAASPANSPETPLKPVTAPIVPTAPTEVSQPAIHQAKAQTIRVASERINSLMDVVGELVILESQLMQTAKPFMAGNTALQRQFSQLQRILKDLQHNSMALQMVPIRPTFQRVERIVRDLSQKLNKKINLTLVGEDTELDRTVVELITDPLVHMIRNAVDHGLENTPDRLKAGKNPVGQIQLKAYHQGSSIIVELVDDGRGIDPEKIRAKAIEKEIVSSDAQLTREETLQLIFAPGFSTAEILTENSGRGVGMDVVKRNVESMRGVVTVTSEIGVGSTFKVKLPLTTAIIDGLIVRVGSDKYIIPTHTVEVTMRPTRKQITKIAGTREMVIMKDRTIPLVRLNRFLGIREGENDPTNASLAIVESFGKHYAIMVDEMINKQEVVIKSLGQVLGKLPGIAGGAILGDGSIALILDPAALARHEAA